MKNERWIELIGLITVVISMVFVGLEIRNSINVSKATALEDLNSNFREIEMTLAENRELAGLVFVAEEEFGPTEVEFWQLLNFYVALLDIYENTYLFYEAGVIDKEQYEAYLPGLCRWFEGESRFNKMYEDGNFTLNASFKTELESRCAIEVRSDQKE